MQIRRLLCLALATFALAACSGETLDDTEAAAAEKWAAVETAFRERAEIVPDLTPAIAAADDAEKEALTQIEDVRRVALKAGIEPDDLDDPVAMDAFAQAQDQFDASIRRMLGEFDSFPELAAMASKTLLEQQLQQQDGRIDKAVEAYNAAVAHHNEKADGFPNNILGASELMPLQLPN